MHLVSHAQNYEDIRLWRAFRDIEKGRYLDIGTQGPEQDSVSLLFYERGWRGLHVEATPHYAEAMRAARPDEEVIQAAVSSSSEPLEFFEIPNTGLSTGVASIAETHEAAGFEFNSLVVPTVTLASLFERMGPDLIHWLKIDVEGMEADAIRSWDDHPARPAALVIEATAPNTQIPTHQDWRPQVLERGYREVAFDGLSRYFIHESHADRAEALGASPSVFDQFQVPRSHFSAGLLGEEREAALAQERAQAAEERETALRQERERAAQETEQRAADFLEERASYETHAQAQIEAANAERDEVKAAADALAARLDEMSDKAARLSADLTATQDELSQASVHNEAAKAQIIELRVQAQAAADHHAQTLSDARADAAEKAGALAIQTQEAERLREQIARAQQSLDDAQKNARERFARYDSDLDQAAALLARLQEERSALSRTVGRLEGELAAQSEASVERLREARSTRRNLERRLDRANEALNEARQEVLERRGAFDLLAQSHASQMAAAKAELAAQQKDSAAALAALDGELAVSHEKAAGLCVERDNALSERDTAREQRDAAQEQRDAAREQRDALGEQKIRLEADKTALEDRERELTQSATALREEAAELRDEAATLRAEIDRLNAHVARREAQLGEADRLFCETPSLLERESWSARWLAGRPRLAAIAQHIEALSRWQTHARAHELVHSPISSFSAEQSVNGAYMSQGHEFTEVEGPINTVPKLLAPHDRQFIHTAYIALLGRPPEPDGEAYYLERLRSGVHKLDILKQLRRSPEGRSFQPGVAGLDRAIRERRLANMPIIGLIVRFFTGAEGDSAAVKRLRILANEVGRSRAENGNAIAGLSAMVAETSHMVKEVNHRIVDLDARVATLAVDKDRFPSGSEVFVPEALAPVAGVSAAPSDAGVSELPLLDDVSSDVTPTSIRLAIRAELQA